MEKRKIVVDAIRGNGQLESVSISSILGCGDESAPMFQKQLDKPLSNEQVELMLSNQAILLNSLANRLIQQSCDLAQISGTTAKEYSDRFLKNSYKSFELSRKCLTALNEIRNPKRSATFIKQQNNQLNLGDQHGGAKMDRISKGKATAFNPNMATLETVHRCEDSRG